MRVNLLYILKKKKERKIGWLYLVILEKGGKEEDDLSGSNSHLKHCTDDPKLSMSALKETFVFCRLRAETVDNQIQHLILSGGLTRHIEFLPCQSVYW